MAGRVSSLDDTIVALATPPGRGGLAVVRISGRQALGVASSLFARPVTLQPRHATRVWVRGGIGQTPETTIRDEAVAVWFAAPASYTGEDVVELSLHGSPPVVAGMIEAAVAAGARMAAAGEFTLRAFLNGRLDLARAEAVRDLVEASTPLQARVAFDQLTGALSGRLGAIEQQLFALTARLEASIDFPEEGYRFIDRAEVLDGVRAAAAQVAALVREGPRGRLVREGATVAFVGRTNVGKSTLFNRLVGGERAIVTAIPGTTRDLLSEVVDLEGLRVTLVDTAGLRASEDPVEREGVARAERASEAADLTVLVLDGSEPLTSEDRRLLALPRERTLIAVNKTDLASAWDPGLLDDRAAAVTGGQEGSVGALTGSARDAIRVSGATGDGLVELIRAIAREVGHQETNPPVLTNIRHIALLERSLDALRSLENLLVGNIGQIPEEMVLSDLQRARDALEEVTGKRTSEDLLDEIFSKFCIGK